MSILTSDLPAGHTLEMPCNNLLTTSFRTVSAASIVAPTSVSNVLFVDGTLGTALGPGSIAEPFATVQQAVTYAALIGLNAVWIQCAPGIYADPIVVPSGLVVGICAWGFHADTTGLPVELGGNILLSDPDAYISFQDISCLMATISAASMLSVTFCNCSSGAEITGADVSLYLNSSDQSGNVTGSSSLTVVTDDKSWYWLLQYDPTLLPAGYARVFHDSGHSVATGTITKTGLAIDDTALVLVTFWGTAIRSNDRAQVQVPDEVVQDFICGVHSVQINAVMVWLTNLSRVSTNFADEVLFTFHHQDMPSLPVPP